MHPSFTWGDSLVIRFDSCKWEKDVPLKANPVRALYKCHRCRKPVTTVSVFSWAEWIEEYADRLESERQVGKLSTRKQSTRECDRDISAAGLGAELAACVLLDPWKLHQWMKRSEQAVGNRGADLPAEWFRDGRAVEVKYTARGEHLLVRPPRNTPGPMLTEYIDDSFYVLMTGTPYTYTIRGWVGRSDLLKLGKLNPIPVRGRQRECWGVKAPSLLSMERLYWLLYRHDATVRATSSMSFRRA